MKSNLIISGGIYHPFEVTSKLLSDILNNFGLNSQIMPVGRGLEELAEKEFDLLTVNALAFTMLQHPKYDSLRDEFGFKTDQKAIKAIKSHLENGGRLLGIHTAAICFDDWPEWEEILGVKWVWGKSWHPEPCMVQVKGSEDFETFDELYCDLNVSDKAEVIATGSTNDRVVSEPILVINDNAAYLALGHDAKAFETVGFVSLLEKAVSKLSIHNLV